MSTQEYITGKQREPRKKVKAQTATDLKDLQYSISFYHNLFLYEIYYSALHIPHYWRSSMNRTQWIETHLERGRKKSEESSKMAKGNYFWCALDVHCSSYVDPFLLPCSTKQQNNSLSVSLPLRSLHYILPSYMFLSSHNTDKSPPKGYQVSKAVEDIKCLEGRLENHHQWPSFLVGPKRFLF